jgi:hypothetical protein
MVQVELNNMHIDIGANSGSEKLWTKNTATTNKLIKAVYDSYVYVYIFLYKLVRSARDVWSNLSQNDCV